MHFKRKKTKRNVRCTICTQTRWKGNNAGRTKDPRSRLQTVRKKELEYNLKDI